MNQAKILHDVNGIHHSSCTVGCNLRMWEDGTYLTSQSDDVDNSPGARVFNTWTTAMQIAISSELNTWNTWFAGKGIRCGYIVFFGCLRTR